MSRYGTDIYGIGRYGAGVLALVDFDATPFTAEPANYGSIKLSWATPTGDWLNLRLVRNRYGFPVAADDGDVLVDSAKENAPTEYRDKGQTPENIGLKQGIVYFYSLFVYSTQDSYWVKAGNASSISPKEFDNGNDFFSLMPAIYQSDTYKTLTASAENEDLKSFLSIFKTYYDFCKTYAELVKNIYDPSTTPIQLLPAFLRQFGLQYEPEIGVQQTRILLKNAALINQKKGSLQGIEDFVKAFTGWDSVVVPTKNIMLNYNDSSFEESIGSWENIAKAELSVIDSDTLLPYESTVLTNLGFPNKQSGSLKVKATSAGDVEFACGLSNPRTKGIPVKGSTLYVFSIYTKAASTARTVTADIIWYDRDMNELSRSGEESLTNATGAWIKRVESSSTSPANAWFAVPYLRIDGAALNEVHYFDAGQFEESTEGATYFSEARGVDITLKANRINLLTNPCFEDNTSPWVSTGASLSIDNSLTETATGSVGSAKLEYDGVSTQVNMNYDDFISVLPDEWYTVSGYLRTAFTGSYDNDFLGNFNIDWYDYSQTLISTTSEPQKNLTEFYNVVSFYRTNGILYVKTEELTSLVPGDQMRLVHFQFDTVDNSGNPITYNLDGTHTVVALVENELQLQISGDNIPLIQNYELENFPLIQDLKLNFNRISATNLSPSNAGFAKVRFEWKNPEVGQDLWIDSVLFERSSSVGSFFDGSRGFSDSSDLIWEGSTNHSRSHYYKNRVAVEKRLIATLPKYLPIGTTFTLKLATEDSF